MKRNTNNGTITNTSDKNNYNKSLNNRNKSETTDKIL